jgi:hypothetical protein
MDETMSNSKTKNKDRRGGPTAAVEKDDLLLSSSKLLANLKNKGILAFKQMTDEEQKLVWKWSKEVIRQYLSKLETNPGNIRTVENLPFPKEDIKLAIKLSLPLYLTKDMQNMVKKLKTAYKELGTFQRIDESDKKEWLSRSDAKDRTSSHNHIPPYALSDKYTEISVSEKKALLREINDFVNDLEALI